MHTLDGSEVNIGDRVFAVGYGSGSVTELLTDNKFRVYFAISQRTVTFDSNGVMARMQARSLFWRDPVLVPPMKDEVMWNRIKPAIVALITAFRPV